jgi:tripartite-type tricarboxylate transporter receptor subunit TctC
LGRDMVAPPGLAADKQKFLEEALKKCVNDSLFQKMAKKQEMEVVFLTGDQAKQLAVKGLGISPAMKTKLKEGVKQYAK